MNKISTQEDLIRYAYNETDLKDSDRIQRTIDGDPLTQSEFNELFQVMNLLNKGMVQPSDESINKILKFSRKI